MSFHYFIIFLIPNQFGYFLVHSIIIIIYSTTLFVVAFSHTVSLTINCDFPGKVSTRINKQEKGTHHRFVRKTPKQIVCILHFLVPGLLICSRLERNYLGRKYIFPFYQPLFAAMQYVCIAVFSVCYNKRNRCTTKSAGRARKTNSGFRGYY